MVTKEKIEKALLSCEFREYANLWKGAKMDENYKDYEVEGFSHPQTWEDGTVHTYDGIYSLNDGKISDKMRDVLNGIRDTVIFDSNVYIRSNIHGEEQAYFMYHNGTNGREGNALNSIRDAANKLEYLQSKTAWATLVTSWSDICDDVYAWVFTFTV